MALQSRRASRLEDPGAELIDRITGIWTSRGRYILGGLAVVAVVVAGVIFYQRAHKQTEAQAAEKLSEATAYFWQGDYAKSMELSRGVIDQYGSTHAGIDAHRLAGDNAFWSGDYKNAIVEYREYLKREPAGMLADAARRSLAYSLESDGQFQEAATLYAGLVGKFDRESDGEMLLAAARCDTAADRADEARQHLQRLVNEFGDTGSARRGREMLAELDLQHPTHS